MWEWCTTVEGRGGRVEASCAVELLALLWCADREVDMLVEALDGARGLVVEEREPRRSLAWDCSPSMVTVVAVVLYCWMLLYRCKERGRVATGATALERELVGAFVVGVVVNARGRCAWGDGMMPAFEEIISKNGVAWPGVAGGRGARSGISGPSYCIGAGQNLVVCSAGGGCRESGGMCWEGRVGR